MDAPESKADDNVEDGFTHYEKDFLPLKVQKINRKKVLSIIGQTRHLLITKNLTFVEIDNLLECDKTLLNFVKKDYYTERNFFGNMFHKLFHKREE